MTVLEMLKSRCDFVPNRGSWIGAALLRDFPRDAVEFYRAANGGTGCLDSLCRVNVPDLRLYPLWKQAGKTGAFLKEAAKDYECFVLLGRRKPDQQERKRVARLRRELKVFGECGDPDLPDYLCFRKGSFFLVEAGSLESVLKEPTEISGVTGFQNFMEAVLWHLEKQRIG